jgi:hypothetical protein
VSREGATVYEATKAASSIRVAGTFTWPVRFTDPALRGPLVARVTVYLANVAEQSLAFQLVG